MQDPCRPGVIDAVNQCKKAKIKVDLLQLLYPIIMFSSFVWGILQIYLLVKIILKICHL